MALINPRHIAFLDEYFANGMKATAAYAKVYPDSSLAACQSSSSDLVKTLKVEIERRMEIASAKHDIKKEELVAHLQQMIQDCIKDGDKPNMIKAINLLARMGGHLDSSDMNTVSAGNININLNLDSNTDDNKPDSFIIL